MYFAVIHVTAQKKKPISKKCTIICNVGRQLRYEILKGFSAKYEKKKRMIIHIILYIQ